MGKESEAASAADSHPLQVEQDVAFERKDARFQRIGWILMLVASLAALAGLLGPGPLTRMTAGERGGQLSAEYYRFERVDRPTDLKVHLKPGEAAGNPVRLWISRPYLESVDLTSIAPQPLGTEVHPDRLVFVFHLANPAEESAIRLHFEHEDFGRKEARVGLMDGPEVSFRQFVYP